MCDKDVLKSCGTLNSVPDCYKNQQICDKAVDNHALKFVHYCFITKKMGDKAGNTHSSTIKFIP